MDKHPHVILAKEDPFLSRFQVADFFDTMKNVAASTATLDLAGAAKDSLNIVKYELSVGHLAHKLIFTALSKAILGLLTEEHRRIIGSTVDSKRKIEMNVQQLEDKLDLKITLDFFRQPPHKFELIRKVRPIYAQWLMSLGLSESEAQKLQKELPAEYLKELANEFHEDEAYQRILDELNSPFNEVFTKQYYKAEYHAELETLIDQPAMGEKNLLLSQIYIKPYFAIHKNCCKNKDWKSEEDGFVVKKLPYEKSIHDYIEERLIYKKQPLGLQVEKENIIFLLGQPGQGKSSFCYYLVDQLLNHPSFEQEIYFIPLKYLNTKELIARPFKQFEEHLNEEKLDFIDDNTILVLDGLDELYMSNGLTNNDLADFYYRLEQKAKQESGLTIILTSRYNYLNLSAINEKVTTILKLAPLQLQQQEQWLRTYRLVNPTCLLTTDKLTAINQEDRLEHIKELIEQPILLHIVAKSGADINAQYTRSTIYKHLFDAIVFRKWSDESLKRYEGLERENGIILFRHWLQEIAFTIYMSNFEYIHREKLLKLSYTKTITDIIDTAQNLNEALKDLLVTFYFKNTKQNQSDPNFKDIPLEFLHKSLQEYLTAEYIWRSIKEDLLDPLDQPYLFKIDTPKKALKLFTKLFSQKELNHSVRFILIEMIQNDSNQEVKKQIRERLKYFLSECLHYQFLYEYNVELNDLIDTPPLNRAFNAFRGYWLVLTHLFFEKNKDLLSNSKANFSALIIRGGGDYINLRRIALSHAVLSHVVLSHADLSLIDLSHATLSHATLRHTDLRDADLQDADLEHADLRNADLSRANLNRVNLRDADLRRIILQGADLQDADLRDVTLRYGTLKDTDLRDADLRDANLRDANLRGADLRGADLRGADLRQGSLNRADLRDANLREANFRGADLRDIDLRDTDLIEADLREVKLRGVKVSSIHFIQQLKDGKCQGVERIEQKFHVNPIPQYDNSNQVKKSPYYIIKKK